MRMNCYCLICIIAIIFNTLQGHRIVYYKCVKDQSGKLVPKRFYSIKNIIICCFEFIFGIYNVYSFWLEIIHFDGYNITIKIKFLTFLFGILSIGNSFLWNLRLESLHCLITSLDDHYHNTFQLTDKELNALQRKYFIQNIIYWMHTIFNLITNIFMNYELNGKSVFVSINCFININFFGCCFHDLNIIEIVNTFLLKIKISIEKSIDSHINEEIFNTVKTARRQYIAVIQCLFEMEKWISYILPFFFIFIVLINVVITSILIDLMILRFSYEEFLIVFIEGMYGFPYYIFARNITEKYESIKKMVSEIIVIILLFILDLSNIISFLCFGKFFALNFQHKD